MHEAGRDLVMEGDAGAATAPGADAAAATNGDADALARLEARVETAVDMIGALREERDALQATLGDRDGTIAGLEAEAKRSSVDDEALGALTAERDQLLQDRATVMRRVETILARLDKLGLE